MGGAMVKNKRHKKQPPTNAMYGCMQLNILLKQICEQIAVWQLGIFEYVTEY